MHALRRDDSTYSQLLERRSTEDLATLNRVAGLAGFRRRFPGAFGNRGVGGPGSKRAAIPEGIHLDTEYRTRGEGGGCNALLRHSRSARHLDAPINQFPVFVLGQF